MGIKISDEAKARYFERRRNDLAQCRKAIANQDFKFIQNLGHQLKGSAVTFGHEKLSELGEILEDQAINKDMLGIKNTIDEFEKYLTQPIN